MALPSGGGSRRRIGYADPPYPDLAARYYGAHPDFAGEVDHERLLEQLATFDAWALSTSARALPDVLRICPSGVRVAAWHRGAANFARSRYALNAWEPVIYLPLPVEPSRSAAKQPSHDHRDAYAVVQDDASGKGSSTTLRRRPSATPPHLVSATGSKLASRDDSAPATHDASPEDLRDTSRGGRARTDSLLYVARPRRTDPGRVTGAKPAAFAGWLFQLLGTSPTDEFTDLFPGSSGMSRAWRVYAAQHDPEQPSAP